MRYEAEVHFRKDFVYVKGDKITIGLTSRPEGGKANLELVKKLAKHFKVSSSQVRIVSGFKSKIKIIEIAEK